MNISIICPTRKRPSNMERLIQTARDTARNPENIDFWFYIDDDDILSLVKLSELQSRFPNRIFGHVGPRIIMTEMSNILAKMAMDKSEFLFFAGDDIAFRTKNWEETMTQTLSQFPDKIGWVFGRDGYHAPGSFGTHGMVHRNWIEVLGYFVPPIYSADWADTTVCEITKNLNRFLYVPVFVEHMHYVVGKGEIDETMREKIMRGNQDRVGQKFVDSIDMRIRDTNKLLEFINRANNSNLTLEYKSYYP